MARTLTGIQSTGTPHLGNLLGAILPAIKMSEQNPGDTYLFIADLHSLTQIKDGDRLRENTYRTAAAWMACGLNTDQSIFYRQSDVRQVTELYWYLNCYFPYQRLTLAHSFKDKSDRLNDVNAGLFTYPMLMAADILLYDAEIVPVGKDQLQHLEMARDVAGRVNYKLGDLLILPEAEVNKETKIVPGTDGEKMSKSRGNTINIFQSDKKLRKQVMGIQTDSTPLEEPKDPASCNVFALYKLLADRTEVEQMEENYKNGGYGYGHAKTALYELLKNRFASERKRFQELVDNPSEIDDALENGAIKARKTAESVLARIRPKMGY